MATVGSRSSVLFDLDNDGDLDLVTNDFNSEPQVLVSDLAQRKPICWLKIVLVGTASNRDGLGATVRVRAEGQVYTKYNDGKSGYLSQSALPLYFGLADAKSVDRIEVDWPSGRNPGGAKLPLFGPSLQTVCLRTRPAASVARNRPKSRLCSTSVISTTLPLNPPKY